jgi:hypothetical protein
MADDTVKAGTAGLTTVVVPAANRTQELTAAQQKKQRDRERREPAPAVVAPALSATTIRRASVDGLRNEQG